MVATQGIVIACTGYLFYKVLITPPKSEPDSFAENEEEEIREED